MTLKTLKDLNWANLEPQRTQLRQEAIKHINFLQIVIDKLVPLQKEIRRYNQFKYLEISGEVGKTKSMIDWIKHFFNITEEDLK